MIIIMKGQKLSRLFQATYFWSPKLIRYSFMTVKLSKFVEEFQLAFLLLPQEKQMKSLEWKFQSVKIGWQSSVARIW